MNKHRKLISFILMIRLEFSQQMLLPRDDVQVIFFVNSNFVSPFFVLTTRHVIDHKIWYLSSFVDLSQNRRHSKLKSNSYIERSS